MEITIYSDKQLIFSTRLESLNIVNPKLNQEINKAGTFTFTMYPNHPFYNVPQKIKSVITIYEDNIKEPLFRGRIYDDKVGFYNEKQVSCEGELAFLNDSIQRPYDFPVSTQKGTPAELFTQFIEEHNRQVDETRQFKVGNITVTDANDYIVRANSAYESTFTNINDKLIKILGGYLWVRHESDGNYIDYLEDFTTLSNQAIEFGKNLLDLAKNSKADNFATAIIPLGTVLTDNDGVATDKRLTISSVNNGIDYLYNAIAVEKYGYIFTTNIWDDVTEAVNLKRKGQAYIDNIAQFSNSIEIKAADLNGTGVNVNSFRIGRYVNVVTKPHSIDMSYVVSKLSRELLKPEKTKLTLGNTYKSLSEQSTTSDQFNNFIKKIESIKNGKDGRDAAIKSDTPPADTSYMWLDTSVEPAILKNWNGSEWETVNDQSQAIYQLEQAFTSSIEQTSQSIIETVSENYYLKEETDSLVSSIQSSLEHTSEGFEMQFNTLMLNIENVANGTDAQFVELSKYIRYVNGKIYLGEVGNELELIISNDRLSFLQDNTEIAYFSNRKLYVTDGEYVNSLQIGAFAFLPRANGNLSFKKIS